MSTPVLPQLPKWTDAAAVTTYLVSLAGFVFAALAAFHVGVPGTIEATVLGACGFAGAVVAQVVNVITHRSAHKAAFVAPTPAPAAPAAP